MNCAEIEILICDYVDGTLDAADKAEVERHLAACPACAELARDSAAAVAFIERAAEVEPPPELITRILFDAPVEQGQAEIEGARRGCGSCSEPDPAAEVRHGNGDDDSFVLHAGAVRGAGAAAAGRRICGRRRSGPVSKTAPYRAWGAHREVLRQPESSFTRSKPRCGNGSSRTKSSGRRTAGKPPDATTGSCR